MVTGAAEGPSEGTRDGGTTLAVPQLPRSEDRCTGKVVLALLVPLPGLSAMVPPSPFMNKCGTASSCATVVHIG
jgi:hypothetical protein